MPNASDNKAMLLASTIIEERNAEIDQEYYRTTTKKTYEKWYGKGDGKSYLGSTYGGSVTIDSEGNAIYKIPSKKYFKMRKVGKRFKPNRRVIKEAVDEANDFVSRNKAEFITVLYGSNEALLRLGYLRSPAQYTSQYVYSVSAGVRGDFNERQQGIRTSSLDRLIFRSIDKWAKQLGISVDVSAYFNGGRK